MKNYFEELLEKLMVDALVLAETFIVTEYTLHSAIADSNEKPYDNLYNMAKSVGALNKINLSAYYLDTIRKASFTSHPVPIAKL